MGSTQVEELGNLETPIILTNTLSVPTAANALISHTLNQNGNENVRSVNTLVGETNDGYLNDIRGSHIKTKHVLSAIQSADTGPLEEGNVGAGTGTSCFGYKGGIGTSSRVLPDVLGGYTVGVIVQSNFGGVLRINGIPVAKKLGSYPFKEALEKSDGSCMIVVATDAPLLPRNLKRLAKRAILGMGNTGGIASNGSGDYVIAFSTYQNNFVKYRMESFEQERVGVHNDALSPLFMATIEATEEAILNSLCAAESMVGRNRHFRQKLPIDKVVEILK
jgi:D-aminopeptidase